MPTLDSVFLLWHVHELEGSDDHVLVGVYRTKEDAQGAASRLQNKPGFAQWARGFLCEEYELNKNHWTEGFVQTD
jgi:hypothetical protein